MSLVMLSHSCRRCLSSRAKDRSTRELIERIIRVDHAGELGADRIYAGQMAVLGKTSVGPVIQVSDYLLSFFSVLGNEIFNFGTLFILI